jgi:eukaryotic-like serine/threonine-protein kinase
MAGTQPTVVADPIIGRVIGNYVVRRLLGQGGMGSVYFAEHPTIGKRIALKVLHAEFAVQPEIVNRFFNEAKAVNDIQHPNIVDIIDFGILPPASPTEPPFVYFFMEYIEGASVTDLLAREGPLPPARALAIAVQIADALAASHRMGIVHRDLKSDNVMLLSRREHDFVKLLDFGIAKMTGSPASSHRTRTGIVMGTPQYMSPEQCEGRSSIDHRTDIYALGILLYQMLTGRVPFFGENFGEVLVQQMAIPPLAPSLITPQISPHLEQVVLKALEKRPEHRYARMDDMMLALRDPVQYVETQGLGFLVSPVLRDPALAGSRAAMAIFATGAGQGGSTTLGGAAAQTTPPQAKPRSGRAIKLGLAGGAAAVIAAAVAIGASRPGAPPPASPGAIAAQSPAAVPGQSTPPAPPPAAPQAPQAPAMPSPPAAVAPQASATTSSEAAGGSQPATPAARSVSITIASTPPGARVFVGGESTMRGTTPFVLESARDTAPIEIRLVLPGYRPQKRTIELDRDREISFLLDKSSGPASAVGKAASAAPAAANRPGDAPAAAKPAGDTPAVAKPAGDAPASAKPAGDAPAAAKPAGTAPEVDRRRGHDDKDDPMDPFAKNPPAAPKAGGQKKEGP